MSTGLVHTNSGDENATANIIKGVKPKPLQASTNIIHTKTPRRIDNLIHEKSRQLPDKRVTEPDKKKQASTNKKTSDLKATKSTNSSENNARSTHKSTSKRATTTTPVKKVDENDVGAMVKNAYDPLSQVYRFDEELFQKVLRLEYADDGIPAFDYSEPFDF